MIEQSQNARFIETGRALLCDEDEAERAKVLTSKAATDAQVFSTLNIGLRQGRWHVEKSREALTESRAALEKADKLIR